MQLPIEPNLAFVSNKTVEPKVLRTDFGDGYSQRAADGINDIREGWSWEYPNMNKTTYDTLEAFLRLVGGHTAVDWTAPDGIARKFSVKRYSATPVGNQGGRISIEVEQEFDLI